MTPAPCLWVLSVITFRAPRLGENVRDIHPNWHCDATYVALTPMQAPLPWTCPLPFKPSCPQLARHHRQQPEVSAIHRRRLVVRLDHRHDAAFHVPSLPRVCRRRHGSHISSARQVYTHSVVAQKLLHACSCASHVYIPPDTATLYMKLRVACVELVCTAGH